jgi:ParB family chromosome partitioning protein
VTPDVGAHDAAVDVTDGSLPPPATTPSSGGATLRSLGSTAAAEPAQAGSRSTTEEMPPAGLLELESVLGDYFATPVHVSMGRGRGRLTIDFADLEDLERIYRLIVHEP